LGAGSWLALFTHITIATENAVFAQPEVRHGSNTSFIWTLLAGFKNALRYGLTGDHIDAREALRIGLVTKVVPPDKLLEECFHLVERIALVPPETVKINLKDRLTVANKIVALCRDHQAGTEIDREAQIVELLLEQKSIFSSSSECLDRIALALKNEVIVKSSLSVSSATFVWIGPVSRRRQNAPSRSSPHRDCDVLAW
jgi:hypothetical protein